MVSPETEVLSVFMTPWMKPTSIQRATSSAWRCGHGRQQRVIGPLGLRRVGIMPCDDVVGEPPHPLGIAAGGEELEGADANMA